MVSFSCGDITKATRQTCISPYYPFFLWVGIMQDTEGQLTLSKWAQESRGMGFQLDHSKSL